jgi:putative flippase GtrA
VVSAAVLATCFRVLHFSSRPSVWAAFVAGATVAFVINRTWAWQRHDKSGLGRDIARYSVVAIGTAVVATIGTSIADHYAVRAGLGPDARTLVQEGAYFGSYTLTFVAKFLLLDRFVFVRADEDSRDQVENTTSA